MNYLDVAYAILQAAGEALHYKEISQRTLDRNLIALQGLTPAAAMGSRLCIDAKQERLHSAMQCRALPWLWA